MPLKGAALSKFCDAPASLCQSAQLDCSRCNSVNKKLAEKRMAQEKQLGNEPKQ